MSDPSSEFTGLVGDIGGTNARFALVRSSGQPLVHGLTLPTTGFADLASALQAYAEQAGMRLPAQACIAIANPIDGDVLRMTNTDWVFSIEETRERLGLQTLRMLNDWEAMALAVPTLGDQERIAIGGGQAVPNAPCGLIGPGTGLGVSSLVRSRAGEWLALPGEGGHVTLSPGHPREADILRVLWRHHPHVSAERVISGMGLENLYQALCELDGQAAQALSAAQIAERALQATCPICHEALQTLCSLLGRVAGNLALTLGARGGIYLGGGMLQHWREFFIASPFRASFEAKGRFAPYMQSIPTWLICAEQPALRGAALALGLHSTA